MVPASTGPPSFLFFFMVFRSNAAPAFRMSRHPPLIRQVYPAGSGTLVPKVYQQLDGTVRNSCLARQELSVSCPYSCASPIVHRANSTVCNPPRARVHVPAPGFWYLPNLIWFGRPLVSSSLPGLPQLCSLSWYRPGLSLPPPNLDNLGRLASWLPICTSTFGHHEHRNVPY